MKLFYTGTSGLLLPVRNKFFYPEEFKDKSRLCYYGSLTNSIEVNSSFYKIPMASTVGKWANDVPENFRFTFKLFKEITHNKNIAFDPAIINKFMEVISNVGEKKGCLLIQFPPSVNISHISQLQYLLARVRANDAEMEWNCAVEFRHPSLYIQEIDDILEELNMGLVLHDKPPAHTPMNDINNSFVYLRFHGPGGSYRGSYSDDILYEYAEYISDWLAEGKAVYTYFNNTMGDAIKNMETLKKFLA